MLGSASFRTGIAPGGALAGPWVRNPLWTSARAVPSLDLRFADNKSLVDATTGAQLVTFTRASSGTYVGSDGLVKTAVTNLVLRSEEFDNAYWTKTNSSTTQDAIAAPNGTITADLLIENSASSTHLVSVGGGMLSGTTYTYSVYAKAAGRDWLIMSPGSTWGYGWFNINNGTLGTLVNGGSNPTAAINAVGNGWYRCSITLTAVANAGIQFLMAASNGTVTYTGNSTSGIYLWGAQLEQSSTVGEYIPTTSTINSAPRFDHNPTTGESLGLLVEEARTNLLLNSATLSTQSVTVAAAANTLSFYGTGTVTLTGVSTAGPLVGTGANNRVSLTFTPTVGVLVLTVSGSVTNAQLEAGAFATSYIPTTTATATRAADVASITGSNFSSWYNQTEGTVFFEGINPAISTTAFAVSDGSTNNRLQMESGTNSRIARVASGGTTQAANSIAYTYGTSQRFAISYATNSINFANAGTLGTEDTSATIPTVDQARIGANPTGANPLNSTIKRLTYWPVRLPNTSLQAITQP